MKAVQVLTIMAGAAPARTSRLSGPNKYIVEVLLRCIGYTYYDRSHYDTSSVLSGVFEVSASTTSSHEFALATSKSPSL